MDVDDSDPVPRARGLKRKNTALIASSDEETDGPPRKIFAKDARGQKPVPQTKRNSALDISDDSGDEVVPTKKKQGPTSKNGPTKAKPRASRIVDPEPEAEMTNEEPKKAAKPSRKRGSPSKKIKREDKKVEDKQKPE